ncbi:MAG: thioredoxin family protein [Thiotrichales bacterium]|nr:MAG: thioredoxin family protein [Thiotrichales bacterium]
MRRLIRNCYLTAVTLVGTALCQHAFAELRDPQSYFFNESFGDFAEELDNARDEGKNGVLIMFQQADCPYCERMRKTVLNHSSVQEFFRRHFLIFHVDIEGDLEITDFNGMETVEKDFAFWQNRVRATPVFAFFDLEGTRVARYTGATTDIEEFMLLGRYVVDEIYQSMSFNRYKREQQTKQP